MYPLLSICIPTLSDVSSLKNNLDILSNENSSLIEIIVCDDCPTQEILEIVEKYQSKLTINYFRGKSEGLDSALIRLIESSSGEYIWWIGDDLLLPGSIKKICQTLSLRNNLIFLWVNSHSIDDDKLTFGKIDDIFFDDRDLLLKHDIGLLGFITATIFRREESLVGMNEAKTHIGSSFTCLFIILNILSLKGQLGMIGDSCFKSREKPSGEIRWYDQFQVFGINLYDIVNEFDNVFTFRNRRKALANNLVKVLKATLVERAMGFNTGFASKTVTTKSLFYRYYSFPQFWIFLPLIFTPTSLISIVYKVYSFIKK